MIYGIDLEIAKIRNKLKEKGLDKNTVIILMGDNGYFLGERQLAGKWLMYDNSIRVPLIVYDPRVKKHRDIDEVALNIDVPATIARFGRCKATGILAWKKPGATGYGKRKSFPRDTILIEHLWEFENIPPSEGVRTADEWKYFRYVNNKSDEELYNLKDDPNGNSQSGIIDRKYTAVLQKFRNKLDELAQKYADPFSGIPSGLTVEYIRDPRFTKIIDSRPEFSWIVPKEAVVQKAYQILVSSGKDLIDKNIGDVWDSGNVRSGKSTNVELGGGPLKPNTTYFWKVRIFDKDNRLTEYSKPQQFTTGTFGDKITSSNYFQVEKIKPAEIQKERGWKLFCRFRERCVSENFKLIILQSNRKY